MNYKLKRKKLTQQAKEIIIKSRFEDFKFLTVGWIARRLGVSVPNLSRAFKQETGGLLLKDHIFMVKMSFCINLIEKNPDLTVKELADLVDYSSSKYFIKVFKDYTMVTPGTYIKMTKISKEMYSSLYFKHYLKLPPFSGEKPVSFQKICDDIINSLKSRD